MKLQKTLRARFYDLVNEKKDKHLAETLANLVRNDVLVIINHNDTTSENELKNITSRTDNDKNTIYISEIIEQYSAEIQLKVGKVIYLTNTDGLLDND
jgi:glutamate 5-kinase